MLINNREFYDILIELDHQRADDIEEIKKSENSSPQIDQQDAKSNELEQSQKQSNYYKERFKNAMKQCYKLMVTLFNCCKDITKMLIVKTKLDYVANHLLNILKSLPLIRLFIKQSDEEKMNTEISKLVVGDAFTNVNLCINKLANILWNCISFKNDETLSNFLKGVIFPTKQYGTYIQELFKLMIDAGVPIKYAKSYLVMLFFRRPIYIMLYNWKTIYIPYITKKAEQSGEQEIDDELHPFTAGDTERDQNGLSNADRIMQEKCQALIYIAQNENLTDFQKNVKISYKIAWETIGSLLIPFFLTFFKIFKLLFNYDSNNNVILHSIETFIYLTLIAYYYYFLIAGLIINNIAISQEERLRPEYNNDNEDDGALKLNTESIIHNYGINDYIQFHREYIESCNNALYEGLILDKAIEWQYFKNIYSVQ